MSKYFIDSSNIKSIDYDPDSKILTVIFKTSGATYTYQDISHETICRVMFAESVGTAFHHLIVKNYKGVKDEG